MALPSCGLPARCSIQTVCDAKELMGGTNMARGPHQPAPSLPRRNVVSRHHPGPLEAHLHSRNDSDLSAGECSPGSHSNTALLVALPWKGELTLVYSLC